MHLDNYVFREDGCSVSMPECPAIQALMCLFLVGCQLPVSMPECLDACFPLTTCIGPLDLIDYDIDRLFWVSYVVWSFFQPLIIAPHPQLAPVFLLGLDPFVSLTS